MTRNIWIGIVVVTVLVAGGWWYFNQSSVPVTSETTQLSTEQTTQQNTNTATQPVVNNQPSQTAQTSPAPSTNTPSSKTYTNSQYGFSVTYPSDVSYTLDNPGRFMSGSVSFSAALNTTTGRLDMGFPSPPESCDVPKTDASHTAPNDLRYESIGGISFAAYTNTSAPPSANQIQKIYQGLYKNECYFFLEDVVSASLSERTQIEAKLDAIVRSFRFN